MLLRCLVVLIAVGVLPAVSGCGGPKDDVPLYSVSGSVTFGGEPLADGEIRFVAEDGRTDGGRITNGRYELKTTPGSKRVEIYATREDPSKMIESAVEEGKMEPTTEMYIPKKYNTASKLNADVAEGGADSVDFALDS